MCPGSRLASFQVMPRFLRAKNQLSLGWKLFKSTKKVMVLFEVRPHSLFLSQEFCYNRSTICPMQVIFKRVLARSFDNIDLYLVVISCFSLLWFGEGRCGLGWGIGLWWSFLFFLLHISPFDLEISIVLFVSLVSMHLAADSASPFSPTLHRSKTHTHTQPHEATKVFSSQLFSVLKKHGNNNGN